MSGRAWARSKNAFSCSMSLPRSISGPHLHQRQPLISCCRLAQWAGGLGTKKTQNGHKEITPSRRAKTWMSWVHELIRLGKANKGGGCWEVGSVGYGISPMCGRPTRTCRQQSRLFSCCASLHFFIFTTTVANCLQGSIRARRARHITHPCGAINRYPEIWRVRRMHSALQYYALYSVRTYLQYNIQSKALSQSTVDSGLARPPSRLVFVCFRAFYLPVALFRVNAGITSVWPVFGLV